MNNTKIEWSTRTFNAVVGCTFGCPYCYARRLNERFGFIKDWNEPQFFPERLKQLNSKKPQNIFMDSMSDIADWKREWIDKVAESIKANPQHNYIFLTKRPYFVPLHWVFTEDNVFVGSSVTKAKELNSRLDVLIKTNNPFLSIEPIHNDVFSNINLCNIAYYLKWIIIGAETGNRKGKVVPKKEWIDNIVKEAKAHHNIPVFMKDSLIPIMGEENMLREFPKGLIHNE